MSAFSGAVLAGGKSTRMGADKALLLVDGEPLVGRSRRALVDAGASEVIAVGGDAAALEQLGFRVVPDGWPGGGPLGAIVTALDAAAEDLVVVLACDLPCIAGAAITQLVSSIEDSDAVVARADGRLQVLIAAYRRRCRIAFRGAIERGEGAVHRALAGVEVREIELADPAWARNANVPEDLA